MLDLEAMQWVKSTTWDRHIGTYRAIATSAKWSVTPTRQTPPTQLEQRGLGLGGMERRPSFPAPSSATAGRLGASSSGTSSRPVTPSPLAGTMEEKQRQAVRDTILTTPSSVGGAGSDSGLGLEEGQQLVQLSCSTRPSSSAPEPIFLYSNHNFTDVRRDLDMISVGEAPSGSSECELEFTSLSKQMTGPALPPGLRFPVGIVVGRHLLVFGTFLSNTVNNFSIWALDLGREGGAGVKSALDSSVSNGNTKQRDVLAWSRIDPGAVLSRGSWNRAVVWKNSVIILGDRERDIAQDYDHRQVRYLSQGTRTQQQLNPSSHRSTSATCSSATSRRSVSISRLCASSRPLRSHSVSSRSRRPRLRTLRSSAATASDLDALAVFSRHAGHGSAPSWPTTRRKQRA